MINLALVINQKIGSNEKDEILKVEIGTVQDRLQIWKSDSNELMGQIWVTRQERLSVPKMLLHKPLCGSYLGDYNFV